MLQNATAALAEKDTRCFLSHGRWGDNVNHFAARAILCDGHLLGGERVGNENITLIVMGDPVALRAQSVNCYITREF